MKSKYFKKQKTHVLRTNIIRLMLSEAMKAINRITEEMILEKTGGFEVDVKEINVSYNPYNEDEITVMMTMYGCQSIRFEISYKPIEILKGVSWDTVILYEGDYISICGDNSYTMVTEKDLKKVFGEYLVDYEKDEDCVTVGISAKAFPEYFS